MDAAVKHSHELTRNKVMHFICSLGKTFFFKSVVIFLKMWRDVRMMGCNRGAPRADPGVVPCSGAPGSTRSVTLHWATNATLLFVLAAWIEAVLVCRYCPENNGAKWKYHQQQLSWTEIRGKQWLHFRGIGLGVFNRSSRFIYPKNL